MKKISVLTLLALFMFTTYAQARTIYDSTGRYIVHDGTLRGQKRAALEKKAENKRQIQAASAASIDYNENINTYTTNNIRRTGRVQPVTTTVGDRQRMRQNH